MRNKAALKKVIAFLLILCSVCLVSCSGNTDGPGESTQTGTYELPGNDNSYGGLFSGIAEIDLVVPTADLSRMFASADDETYYQASATVNGTKCAGIGIKTRGNTSYVAESGGNRYSFKLKFGKYQKGTKLNGLDELYLNNMSYDPSYLREYLAYLAFAKLGCKAPLASFAKVTINGEYFGLYLAVEGTDDSFLKRAFGDNEGSLYKAQKGADLLTADASRFELKNGPDSSFSNITRLVDALASGEGIEDVLDVTSVLKYAAIVSVLGCEDSYLGSKAENYYLYESDGILSIVPWDMKLSFGTDGSLRKSEYTIKASLVEASVTEPYFDESPTLHPLVSVLLAKEEYYAEYIGYVKNVSDYLAECADSLLPALKTLINDAVQADEKRFYELSVYEAEFTAGDTTLLGFINSRRANVIAQIGE